MSKFTDALNRPLPSKLNADSIITESEEMNEEMDNVDADENLDTEGCEKEGSFGSECDGGDCSDDIEDIVDDDGFNPDNLSDEELADLDASLGDDALGAVAGGDDEQVKLSPDEEIEADDMMSVAATTMLVRDEMNVEERTHFVENESRIAVNEGFMTESDVNELANELGLVQEANYNRKMIIRLDAESKKKQLYALAVNVSAAAHNDPDYIKLKKVMKMRKVLRARLEKKYHAEATKRMKVYYARLRRSKSDSLSKVGKKYSE